MVQIHRKGNYLLFITPSEYEGLSIEQLAKEKLQIPKKLLHELRMERGITINGHPIDWKTSIKKNDRIMIKCFKEEDFGVIPADLNVDILYEDDHLLIVNKPIGMDTHPTEPNQINTLANGIAYEWQLRGVFSKVRHVHRLDRDTSGVILFAKHPLSSSILDGMLERREIKRTYLAFAEGIIQQKKGTINEPIGRDRHHATRRRVSNSGQKAVTHYEVLAQFKKQNITKVQLQLDTGRTHQIRVHLSHIGHPLVGDELYGGHSTYMTRQALHAVKISFLHPFTKEPLVIEAPLPADLQNIEKRFK